MQGKSFCGAVESKYIHVLKKKYHLLFSNSDEKFTNTSIRKYHSHKLAPAGAPTHIQQASLSQSTRFYNAGPGPKSERMGTKKKIAAVIAGERKACNSPDHPIPQHAAQASKQSPSVSNFAPTIMVTEQTSTHTAKKLRFSFQAPNAQINFEYDV